MVLQKKDRRFKGLAPEHLPIARDAMNFVYDKMGSLAITQNKNSYIDEYARFVIWSLNNNKRPDANNAKYRFITQKTVDEYYTEEVPKRLAMRTHNSLKRICNALEWMFQNIEIGSDDNYPAQLLQEENLISNPPTLNFNSHAVKEGEKKHRVNVRRQMPEQTKADDPFNGLKADLLTTPEKKKMLTYMFNERGDSCHLAASFNWGCNAGVRGATSRDLRLCDLYVSHGFAHNHGRSLTVVIRKDGPKSSFTADRLTGCLRHREYLLCSIFATALRVTEALINNGHEISFERPDATEGASWWQTPFVKFETLQNESSAMGKVRLEVV